MKIIRYILVFLLLYSFRGSLYIFFLYIHIYVFGPPVCSLIQVLFMSWYIEPQIGVKVRSSLFLDDLACRTACTTTIFFFGWICFFVVELVVLGRSRASVA
jgi:hypothetical protein